VRTKRNHSGEWFEGERFSENVVGRCNLPVAGLRAKARLALETMERRFTAFGANWKDVPVSQI
jgi:hypothetical protein